MVDTFERLAQIIERRKRADPTTSYVAHLYCKGGDHILKKVGEEAFETVLAAKAGEREQIIHETADLWFHTLVMLAYNGLHPQAVLDELERRFGTSGIEEKAARNGDKSASARRQ